MFRWLRNAGCAAALIALLPLWPAWSQDGPSVLIVDRDRVMAESAPALALRELEQARRVELRASFDGMRQELEAEEAEIAAFRQDASPSEFEERVRAFDQRVRAARRSSQQASEALQAEFARARRRLAAAVNPILIALLEERRAEVVLDAKTVLLASDQLDVTADVIDRLAETEIDFGFDDAGEAAVE